MRESPTPPPTTWLEAVQQWSDSWWTIWRAAWPQMPWPPAGTLMPPPSEPEPAPPATTAESHRDARPAAPPRRVRTGKRGT